jgi:hypothetical protein
MDMIKSLKSINFNNFSFDHNIDGSIETEREGTDLVFEIILNHAGCDAITFTPGLTDGTAIVSTDTGTPLQYSTYGGTSFMSWSVGAITIHAGVTNVSFYVSSTKDLYDEKSETFTMTVTSPTTETDNEIGTIFDYIIYESGTVFHDLDKFIAYMVNVLHGVINFNIIVKVTELNKVITNGQIIVRTPKENRLSFDGPYDPDLTILGTTRLNNSNWSYSENSQNFIFTSNAVIGIKSYSTFGFKAIVDTGLTKGIYALTTQILEGSRSENRINNNVDAEKIYYNIY